MGKKFLYVGNWGFHPAPKGISRFLYEEETGELTLQETIRPDVAAGQLCLDEARGILYAVNERGDRTNEYGGGGSLRPSGSIRRPARWTRSANATPCAPSPLTCASTAAESTS